MKHGVSLLLMIFLLKSIPTPGQGCSDAGVCSLGSMKSGDKDFGNHTFSVGQTAEIGEEWTFISSTLIEANLALFPKIFISARIPFTFTKGNLGSTNGLGDLLASANYLFWQKDDAALIITVGGKIAISNADKSNEQLLPLPMPYQTSLGSSDLMAGITYNNESWHFALGYQHTLNRNENEFLHSKWPGDTEAQAYFESNRLWRGDDLMIRAERSFEKGRRTITLGLLPILRLQKDEILDENNQTVLLDGSNQLTINLNIGYSYALNEKVSLRFRYANPIVWRESRPDGLTRYVVLYGGLTISL